MKLTQVAIDRLTLPAGKADHIVFDDSLPGFGVRLRKGGAAMYLVQYKIGKQNRRLSLGRVAGMPLAKARAAAGELLAKVRLGIDVAAEKAVRVSEAQQTVGVAVTTYLARVEKAARPNTHRSIKLYLNNYASPLHGLPMKAINRAAIAQRLAAIDAERGAVVADAARSALSGFFAWAMREGMVEINPVMATNRPVAKASRRERVLSMDELAAIWQGVEDDDFGRVIRLLMLTGCRRMEIGGALWSELDLTNAVLTISAERAKNRQERAAYLSPAAVDIFASQPQMISRAQVFGQGKDGLAGYDRPKTRLDAASGVTGWVIHDIRRSFATHMGKTLQVPPHVVECMLGHTSGHKAGVAGIYNLSVYETEQREALNRWADKIAPG